jgi:alkaline phosphatase
VAADARQEVRDWSASGRKQLESRLAARPRVRRAKNLIVFLADGAGPTLLAAARIHAAQSKKAGSEDGRLAYEDLPQVAIARTSSTDNYVTDSAASATAILTGIKTLNGAVGVPAGFQTRHCGDPLARPRNLNEIATATGRATGIVTTTYVIDASPAAFFGHAPSRGWASDDSVPEEARAAGCRGLAEQLVGSSLRVALGGGRRFFAANGSKDPETGHSGSRKDDRDLLQEWTQKGGAVVQDRQGLAGVKPEKTTRLLGLFARGEMFDEADQKTNPTLTEMTMAALDVLEKDKEGYVLFVEEEGTDGFQHEGLIGAALDSYLAFDDAVAATLKRIDLDDTLVIVTSDHGHALSMAGPAPTGEPILGLAKRPVGGRMEPIPAHDGMPFPILGLYTGPKGAGSRSELTDEKAMDRKFVFPRAVSLPKAQHSGDDVGIFAAGPGSELISGMMDQHALFHIMQYALDPARSARPRK